MPAHRLLALLLAVILLAAMPAAAAGPSIPSKVPPPRPKYEPRPPAPAEDKVWIPGEWRRVGGTWAWSRGRYVERPGPGYRWVRGTWQARSYGWVHRPGTWAIDPDALDPFSYDGSQ